MGYGGELIAKHPRGTNCKDIDFQMKKKIVNGIVHGHENTQMHQNDQTSGNEKEPILIELELRNIGQRRVLA